ELRRALAEAGQSRVLQLFGQASSGRRHVVEEVVRAAESLSAKKVGALIVLERTSGLRHYAELGVRVDASVSAELLGSIFLPASPPPPGPVCWAHSSPPPRPCTTAPSSSRVGASPSPAASFHSPEP